MERKYELIKDDFITEGEHTLYRIRALKDFGGVSKGERGGYIEKEENLSQMGRCWVYHDAMVYGNVRVDWDAKIYNIARIFGNARVIDNAEISGRARVFDNAMVSGNASVEDHASVYGNARVSGHVKIYDNVRVCDTAGIFGYCCLYDDVKVYGDATVTDTSTISGNAIICGTARVDGQTKISNDAYISNETADYVTMGHISIKDGYVTFYLTEDKLIRVACNWCDGFIPEFLENVDQIYRNNERVKKGYLSAVECAKTILLHGEDK